MALSDELPGEVQGIFRSSWSARDGYVVPDSDSVKFVNDSVLLDAVVLYADIDGSTMLVDTYQAQFAAEIYKAFLHCAAKIIRSEGGDITAYDGDRVMAVFIGDFKNTSAVRAALKINRARLQIINPAIKKQYPDSPYEVKHTVGVDAGKLLVAKTGIRNANDLVWVGRAANHAAKLCVFDSSYPTRISSEVYNSCNDVVKYANGTSMWEIIDWTDMKRKYYRSNYMWASV